MISLLESASRNRRVKILQRGVPFVIMVVGVNGVGKTTSIAKLAAYHQGFGRNVLIAAGDTFRAAAIDQLKVWGERVGAPVIAHEQGSDPGAIVFDAMQAAHARGVDVLIVDTAGRLHTKHNLMAELTKLRRIMQKTVPEAPQETILVIDATTGQNGLVQAKEFAEGRRHLRHPHRQARRHGQRRHRLLRRQRAGHADLVRRDRRKGDRPRRVPAGYVCRLALLRRGRGVLAPLLRLLRDLLRARSPPTQSSGWFWVTLLPFAQHDQAQPQDQRRYRPCFPAVFFEDPGSIGFECSSADELDLPRLQAGRSCRRPSDSSA